MKRKITATWALVAVVVAATVLAMADTSYADRGRDRDRTPGRTARDDHRYTDRFSDRHGRDFNRSRITTARPWDQYDRGYRYLGPPIRQLHGGCLITVQTTVICQPLVIHGGGVFFGLSGRW